MPPGSMLPSGLPLTPRIPLAALLLFLLGCVLFFKPQIRATDDVYFLYYTSFKYTHDIITPLEAIFNYKTETARSPLCLYRESVRLKSHDSYESLSLALFTIRKMFPPDFRSDPKLIPSSFLAMNITLFLLFFGGAYLIASRSNNGKYAIIIPLFIAFEIVCQKTISQTSWLWLYKSSDSFPSLLYSGVQYILSPANSFTILGLYPRSSALFILALAYWRRWSVDNTWTYALALAAVLFHPATGILGLTLFFIGDLLNRPSNLKKPSFYLPTIACAPLSLSVAAYIGRFDAKTWGAGVALLAAAIIAALIFNTRRRPSIITVFSKKSISTTDTIIALLVFVGTSSYAVMGINATSDLTAKYLFGNLAGRIASILRIPIISYLILIIIETLSARCGNLKGVIQTIRNEFNPRTRIGISMLSLVVAVGFFMSVTVYRHARIDNFHTQVNVEELLPPESCPEKQLYYLAVQDALHGTTALNDLLAHLRLMQE